MSSVYPNAIDSYAQIPLVVDNITPITAATVNRFRSAILAIENELGTIPSGEYSSLSSRLDDISANIESILASVAALEAGAINIIPTTITSNYEILATDQVVLVDCTSGMIEVKLPDPADSKKIIHIKKIDESLNDANIMQFLSETIDGLTFIRVSSQYMSISLISDGTNWHIV